MRIYTSRGRLVYDMATDDLRREGHWSVTWDGRDQKNRLVKAGSYRIEVEATNASGKTSAPASGTVKVKR